MWWNNTRFSKSDAGFVNGLHIYFRSLSCAREMSTLMSTNKYAFTSQNHRVTIDLFYSIGALWRIGLLPTSSSATIWKCLCILERSCRVANLCHGLDGVNTRSMCKVMPIHLQFTWWHKWRKFKRSSILLGNKETDF